MSLKMKLNLVNKHEYEENEDYRELVIKIPEEIERLEEDFRYLGLDYNNLSIKDTHILKCTVIDTENLQIAIELTKEITSIMDRANQNGYTTTYQDIKKMFDLINRFDREKLLAILELKRDDISNINGAVKYANKVKEYNLLKDVNNLTDMGKYLVEETGHFDEVSLLSDYIDYEGLACDYIKSGYVYAGKFTKFGYLMKKEEFQNNQEDEEEFGDEM